MDRGQKNEDGDESQEILSLSCKGAKTIDFNIDITRWSKELKLGQKPISFEFELQRSQDNRFKYGYHNMVKRIKIGAKAKKF